jgi:hypothetical protein
MSQYRAFVVAMLKLGFRCQRFSGMREMIPCPMNLASVSRSPLYVADVKSPLIVCVFSSLSPALLAPWIFEDFNAKPSTENSSWDESTSGSHFLMVSCLLLLFLNYSVLSVDITLLC